MTKPNRGYLQRVEVSGYRSLRGLVLEDLRRINVLVGPNNVGKSNLFRMLLWLSRLDFTRLGNPPLQKEDSWQQEEGAAEVLLEVDQSLFTVEWTPFQKEMISERGKVLLTFRLPTTVDSSFRGLIPKVFFPGKETFIDGLKPISIGERKKNAQRVGKQSLDKIPAYHLWDADKRGVVEAITEERAHEVRCDCAALFDSLGSAMVYVTALRSLTKAGDSEKEGARVIDGTRVIQDLQKLEADRIAWRQVTDELADWFTILMGQEVNQIQLYGSEIRLRVGGLIHDLQDLGAGVSEFLILLLALRLEPDKKRILLLEEPEAHLHPSAVVALLEIIGVSFRETQVFVTSHSAALLDAAKSDWRIFRITQDDKSATRAISIHPGKHPNTSRKLPDIRLEMLQDLGIRPSQIFLANSVVLVEGPSDAIYLEALLSQVDPALRRDRDYAFVIYGGSSLHHYGFLRAEETSAEHLVSLFALCHKPLAVYDHDGEKAKRYATRLKELADGHKRALAVATPGREIENLVAPGTLFAHLQSVIRTLKEGPLQFVEESWNTENWADPYSATVPARMARAARLEQRGEAPLESDQARRLCGQFENRKVEIATRIAANADKNTFTDEAVAWCRKTIVPFIRDTYGTHASEQRKRVREQQAREAQRPA